MYRTICVAAFLLVTNADAQKINLNERSGRFNLICQTDSIDDIKRCEVTTDLPRFAVFGFTTNKHVTWFVLQSADGFEIGSKILIRIDGKTALEFNAPKNVKLFQLAPHFKDESAHFSAILNGKTVIVRFTDRAGKQATEEINTLGMAELFSKAKTEVR